MGEVGACSSAGRASHLHCGGQRFESARVHKTCVLYQLKVVCIILVWKITVNVNLFLAAIGKFPSKWCLVTVEVLLDLWRGVLVFIPKLLGASFIFVIGCVTANMMGKLVSEILHRLHLDKAFDKTGWIQAFKKAEIKVSVSDFLGAIVKWILVFVFLLAVVEVLEFLEFAAFLSRILAFIPSVIVSVLIFIVSVVASDILEKIVVASVEKAEVGYSRLAGLLARWAVLGFAVLAILVQLGIAKELVLIFFTGVVAFLVISFGLAFGLGGKEVAADILKNLRGKLK